MTPQFSPLQSHFSEQDLLFRHAQLLHFWQQGQHRFFTANDGTLLHCSSFIQPNARASLLICPGRIEAADKYMESCFDLYQAGFNLYLPDHRGQGRSARLTADHQLGHVGTFADYVADLQHYIATQVRPTATAPLVALGHSMGAAILCRYLQTVAEQPFCAVVFCSPMFGIKTAGLPASFAQALASTLAWWQAQPAYFPGQKPYQPPAFADNALCQSEGRYQWFRNLYQQYPELQLGGVSSHWLAQALHACRQIQHGAQLSIPQLILQAGADSVVSNQAQWRYAASQPNARLHHIGHARHELFLETDAIRHQLYQQLELFWQQCGI